MLSRQPRRTGARRSGGLGAQARQRAVDSPGLELLPGDATTTSLDLLRDGSARPTTGATRAAGEPRAGRRGRLAFASPRPGSGRRWVKAAPAGGSAFPPRGPPCGPRTSCPAIPEGGDCRGPGRAEQSCGVSGGQAPRPVGEGAVFNPGPAGCDGRDGRVTPARGSKNGGSITPRIWKLSRAVGSAASVAVPGHLSRARPVFCRHEAPVAGWAELHQPPPPPPAAAAPALPPPGRRRTRVVLPACPSRARGAALVGQVSSLAESPRGPGSLWWSSLEGLRSRQGRLRPSHSGGPSPGSVEGDQGNPGRELVVPGRHPPTHTYACPLVPFPLPPALPASSWPLVPRLP